MNHAGEISTLVRIAEPDVRVWTNVGEAHLGFFASVDAIADAKAEILETRDAGLAPRRQRGRRPRSPRRSERLPGRSSRSASSDPPTCAPTPSSTAASTARARACRHGTEPSIRRRRCIGRGNLANILAATAVGTRVRACRSTAIAERAATLRPAHHRGEVVRLAGGVTVVDDSYNANPTATQPRRSTCWPAAHGGAARRGHRRDARARRAFGCAA